MAENRQHPPTPQERALTELHSAALNLTETCCDVLEGMLKDAELPAELRIRCAVAYLARVAPALDPVAFRQREQERRIRQLELDAQEARAEARANRAELERQHGPLT